MAFTKVSDLSTLRENLRQNFAYYLIGSTIMQVSLTWALKIVEGLIRYSPENAIYNGN